MSTKSDLSGAVTLEGTTVDGDIYVFTGPDTGVSKVIFSVDGVVTQTESLAPYELMGGSAFDTSKLSSGKHKITADIKLTNGTSKLVSGVFTIPSADTGSGNTDLYDLFVTTSSNLSGAVPLDGSTVDGDIYVFTGPDTGVSQVVFSLDGAVVMTESLAPYELAGGAAFDASKLSPGQHKITADIKLTNGSSKLVSGVFTIPSAGSGNNNLHDIFMSKSSNLSGATALEGAKVDGNIYVFTGPDTGVSRVIFSVDGVVTRTESLAPYELMGGAAFDTSKLSPGKHEITADIQLSDGSSELVSAIFTVPFTDSLYSLLVSKTPYLSSATALEGATVGGDIYVFTGPDTEVSRVIFSVDGVVGRTESLAPFELEGGAAFNTKQLSSGVHQVTASVQLKNGSTEVIGASFVVKN
jgi:CxxC motif-containing protein